MMKTMVKRQEAKKNQEKTLKMVSRKRVNHHMIRKG